MVDRLLIDELRPDEWTDDAENEPTEEDELWWARMLAEEEGDDQC